MRAPVTRSPAYDRSLAASRTSSVATKDIDVARGLGWLSIGLGLTELLATDWLQEEIGVEGHATLVRALGVREVVTGVGLLSQKKPAGLAAGLWARVGGDAIDGALLAAAAPSTKKPVGLGVATVLALGITAVDFLYAVRLQTRATAERPAK